MMDYISEKYPDDSFEFMNLTGGHLGSEDTKIYVRSRKYPDKEIKVICWHSGEKEIFTDTYLNIKFEQQTRDYIKNALVGQFGDDVYAHYKPPSLGNMEDGTAQTTFEEYISSETTYVRFSAAIVLGDISEEQPR